MVVIDIDQPPQPTGHRLINTLARIRTRSLRQQLCSAESFFITAIITVPSNGSPTKYTALVVHDDKNARKKHEQTVLPFRCDEALDQLLALYKQPLIVASAESLSFRALTLILDETHMLESAGICIA